MYTVWMFDDFACEYVQVFAGSLADCEVYVADDEFDDDMFIEAPDGVTVVG